MRSCNPSSRAFTTSCAAGFDVAPGEMGENITTRSVDLLALAAGTRLRLGATAVVEITGLRNPCLQLDGIELPALPHIPLEPV